MLSVHLGDEGRPDPSRREVLRAGAMALGGLTLPGLLQLQAAPAADTPNKGAAKAKSVIIFCTNGGTAQHESFDPKPDAPAEIRGPYQGIATNVPGVRINEFLPRLAKLADKFALLRSLHHTDTVHPAALYLTLCGARIPRAVTPESATGSREDRPHFGSVVSSLQPARKGLPSFVLMPAAMGPNGPEWPGQFAGFLGPDADPYRVNSDPNLPDFSPGAVASDPSLTGKRIDRRKALRAQVSQQLGHLEKKAAARALDPHYAKAFDLISSPAAQTAFDLGAEPAAVRDRYGRHYFGQCCLLARRLVEAGVKLVQINWMRSNIGGRGGPGYDTHANHFNLIKNDLYPPTDLAFSALIEDLQSRGLLDETLVIFHNEFGRTPRINAAQGRDHWPQVYSMLLAGGGVKGGAVYGASDKSGAFPAADPATPQDVLATVYHLLGIDLETVLYDNLKRPHHVIDGKPIRAIV